MIIDITLLPSNFSPGPGPYGLHNQYLENMILFGLMWWLKLY